MVRQVLEKVLGEEVQGILSRIGNPRESIGWADRGIKDYGETLFWKK